mmetsp:Transcript_37873/g.108198  ORF Transcript_37873/g.108198 Transcript_37873/m.108198 type:complete len:89 (-) Transcript_37873:385-651(-)
MLSLCGCVFLCVCVCVCDPIDQAWEREVAVGMTWGRLVSLGDRLASPFDLLPRVPSIGHTHTRRGSGRVPLLHEPATVVTDEGEETST